MVLHCIAANAIKINRLFRSERNKRRKNIKVRVGVLCDAFPIFSREKRELCGDKINFESLINTFVGGKWESAASDNSCGPISKRTCKSRGFDALTKMHAKFFPIHFLYYGIDLSTVAVANYRMSKFKI